MLPQQNKNKINNRIFFIKASLVLYLLHHTLGIITLDPLKSCAIVLNVKDGAVFVTLSLQFDVTRERIRQIEVKALKKLRHPSRSKKLLNFVEKDIEDMDIDEDDNEQLLDESDE